MIKDIHIQNYHSIKDLKINDCKRINLLVGKNGAGKTAILESIKKKYENKVIFPDIFEEYYKDVSEYRSLRKLGFKPQARDLVLNYFKKEEKIFLFEEIENGLHHSVMKDFWLNVIAATIENDVQIFATTHSREMIQSLVKVCQEGAIDEKDFVVFSLDKDGEKNYVDDYRGKNLQILIDNGGEIR